MGIFIFSIICIIAVFVSDMVDQKLTEILDGTEDKDKTRGE